MVKVSMEFELEDLLQQKLLVKRGEEYVEVVLKDFRKGLVKLKDRNDDEEYWIEEEKLEIIDILFR